MQKRGISGIVVTVLVVLLALVAVGIIWAIVNPMLKSAGQQAQDEMAFSSVEFEVKDVRLDGAGTLQFSLIRKAGGGLVSGFIVVLENNTGSSATIDFWKAQPIAVLESVPITIYGKSSGGTPFHGIGPNITQLSVHAVAPSSSGGTNTVTSPAPMATVGGNSGSGSGSGSGSDGEDPITPAVECLTDSACTPRSCNTRSCDLSTNKCVYTALADGTGCGRGGTCQSGICTTPPQCVPDCSESVYVDACANFADNGCGGTCQRETHGTACTTEGHAGTCFEEVCDYCGNGVVNPYREDCDSGMLSTGIPQSCEEAGFAGGTVTCNPDCSVFFDCFNA